MNSVDCARFFNDVIAMMSADLMVPDGAAKLLEQEELTNKLADKKADKPVNKECATRVLSKKYLSIEELTEDNGKDINYDKQYDNTYYDVIDEYKAELDLIPEQSSKIAHLQTKISESTGMNSDNAKLEAEAMILGYRPVKEGDYAILVVSEDQVFYYKRRDNTWIRDESIPESTMADTNSLFCNLDDKCISVNDDCVSLPAAAIDIQKNTAKQMIEEFSESLKSGSETMDDKLMAATNNASSRLAPLMNLLTREFMKDDTIKFELGASAKEVVAEKSPYADVLSLILSQSDFVKRQNDITRFVSYYTRPANPEEDQWLNTTALEEFVLQPAREDYVSNQTLILITMSFLLPTFVYPGKSFSGYPVSGGDYSEIFVNGGNYFLELQKVASQQGPVCRPRGRSSTLKDHLSSVKTAIVDINIVDGIITRY